ncbi:hypothetical protein ACFY5H_24255 [Streptomyces sp. NPDC013012]|uniref:hypothetical protein n=1 Tax=Streptomyces sp. NPDC013012 TaxID=3364860 RepID=UPI003686BB23
MDPYAPVPPPSPSPSPPPAARPWWRRPGPVALGVLAVFAGGLVLFGGPSGEPGGSAGDAKRGGRPEASASPSSAGAADTGAPSTGPPTPTGPPQLVGKVLKEAREAADGAGYDVVTHDASDRNDGQWDADGWKVCFQTAGGQRGGGRPVLDLGVVRVDSPCPAADGEEVSWPSMPGVAGTDFARAGEILKEVGIRKVRPESVYTDVTLPADPSAWRVCFQDPAPGKEIENPQYATAYLKLAPPDAACPEEPYARLRP